MRAKIAMVTIDAKQLRELWHALIAPIVRSDYNDTLTIKLNLQHSYLLML